MNAISGLTQQQQQAVDYNETNLLVAAAAGSGKTRVLVERLINACEKGANIDDFLIITYTRAAALELRGRIQKSIMDRRRKNPQDKRLYTQLLRLHRANIGTIHAFCGGLLREYAAEVGVRPNFRQLEGAEENALKRKALENALEELYTTRPEGFDVLADSLSDIGGDRRLGEVILSLYDNLQAFPSPDMWMEERLAGEYDYRRYLKKDADRALDFAQKLMVKARHDLAEFPELEAVYGSTFDEDLTNIAALKNGLDITHTTLKAARGMTDIAKPFKDARAYYKKIADAYRARLNDEDVSPEDERRMHELTLGIFTAVRAFTKAYSDLKFRKGVLDFPDLEHMAHSLLCGGNNLGIKFSEVLVDEYQDVNRVQEEIINALNSRVFMVGDVRQSVYGFRQADPKIFLEKYNTWADTNSSGARIILPHNFRSHPMLIDAVNDIFEKIMLGMDYGENERLRPSPDIGIIPPPEGGRGVACNHIVPPRATLVYCDKADIDDEDNMSLRRVQLEAEMVADLCRELVDNGKNPWDIAVLLRVKSDMGFFKRALAARNLPVVGQEDNIFETPELRAMLCFLEILDNPRNDIALLAVMRSPLYNFSPNELLEVRRLSDGDFYDALTVAAESGNSKCDLLLRDLIYLSDLGCDRGMDMLYHSILQRLGLLELFGSMRGGAARRRNLLSIIPVAAGAATVSELCRTLERMRESGEMPFSTEQRGIALMTVHKSKGLEFDTVVFADTARGFNRTDTREPVLFHKEMGLGLKLTDTERRVQFSTLKREAVAKKLNEDMLEEEMRVLYVALTRAKQHLYVTMTTPGIEKKTAALSMGLCGKPDEYRLLTANSMSDWLLLALLNDGRLEDTRSWSVRSFNGSKIEREDVRDETFTPRERCAPRAAEYTTVPSKVTVTELSKGEQNSPAAQPATFAKPRFMEKHAKLSAAERGTALHAALQFVDYKKCLTVDGVRAELLRLECEQRLTREQTSSVEPDKIRGFLDSGIGKRVIAAEVVKRELAFSLLTPVRDLMQIDSDEKVLFQGVVDLLFNEDGGWVIVDFKSGKPKPAYARQLELYMDAVRRMTGQRVKEGLIYYL